MATSKSVLFVEDNLDDVALILRAFRKHRLSASPVFAHDGVEALEMLRGARPGHQAIPRPYAVVLDIRMPRMDGFECLQAIRADSKLAHLPVIVFTSSSESEDIARSYDLGASSYVAKPVDSEGFSETISRIVNYWLELNSPLRDQQDLRLTHRFKF